MIGHQTDREQWEIDAFLRLAYVGEERGIVGGSVEYARLLIAAIDDVIALVGRDRSQSAGHASR